MLWRPCKRTTWKVQPLSCLSARGRSSKCRLSACTSQGNCRCAASRHRLCPSLAVGKCQWRCQRSYQLSAHFASIKAGMPWSVRRRRTQGFAATCASDLLSCMRASLRVMTQAGLGWSSLSRYCGERSRCRSEHRASWADQFWGFWLWTVGPPFLYFKALHLGLALQLLWSFCKGL